MRMFNKVCIFCLLFSQSLLCSIDNKSPWPPAFLEYYKKFNENKLTCIDLRIIEYATSNTFIDNKVRFYLHCMLSKIYFCNTLPQLAYEHSQKALIYKNNVTSVDIDNINQWINVIKPFCFTNNQQSHESSPIKYEDDDLEILIKNEQDNFL